MHIEPADERDSSWERHSPRFRVYFFDIARGVTDTYDVTDVEVLDVTNWARDKAGSDQLYAVALVQDGTGSQSGRRGLVWLLGADLVYAPRERLSEKERGTLEHMEARRARAS